MKILVLLLAAWVLLATPSAAHAAPVVALVSAIATAIGSLGAFGQAIFGLVLKVGASLLAKAMQREPEPVGVRGQIQVGGDNPVSFIVGTYATTGQLEYVGTWGKSGKTPNAYLTQVISLSDLPVTGLVDLFVNGEKVTIDYDDTSYGDWGFPVKEYADGSDNALWVKFYDGTQTTADPLLMAEFGDHEERPWTAEMIGRGVAYAVVTGQFRRDRLTGPPRCTFVLEGIKLYDPRKDTTAGGSGPHRWGDPETYEWSDNPKVIQYNVMRGIHYGGEWVYGGQGMRAFQLPASSWFAAMNECDRLVPKKAGGTEKNFRCGFEVKGDLEPIELCQKLDRACNGKTAENGGIYKTVCGNPGMPVYYFTDENLIVSEPQSFNPFPGLEKTYNGAHASYPEPEEAWAAKDAPPRYRSDLEEEDDGRRLIANLTYEAVPYKRQVQRLMRAALEANRRFRSHQGVFTPAAKLLEPLDVISWSSARNGYENKRFQLGAIDDLNNVNQSAAFSELEPSDYDWSTDYELPDSVGPIGRVKPQPQVLTGFGVFPDTVKDANGNDRRPAILLVWPWDADDVAIRAIAFRVRRQDNQEMVFAGRFDDPEDGQVLLAPFSLVGNEDYEVRAKFITNSNTELFAWSSWLPVTTPDVKFIAEDILDGAVTAQKIADAAITAAKLMDEAVTELKIADRAISTLKVQLDAITTELVGNAAIVQSKIASGAVADAQLAALAVTAAKLANNAVTETKIADESITTPKLVANAVVAEKIAAGAILTSKLVVANLENAFAGSEDPTTTGWLIVPGNGGLFSTTVTYNGKPYSVGITPGGTLVTFNYPASIGVSEGEQYYVSFMMRRSATWDGTAGNSKLRFGDQDNTLRAALSYAAADAPATTWTKRELIYTVPAGVTRLRPALYSDATAGTLHLSDFVFRKMASSELIVDGAIIADKLAANSVTSSKIVAGSVTATELATGSVTAVKIASEAVTAAKIAANTITSDKLVANSITARELVLTDFENIIPNGFFTDGTFNGWSNVSSDIQVIAGSRTPFIARYQPVTTQSSMQTAENIQCSPGDKFHVQFDYNGFGTPAGTFRIVMLYTNSAGAAEGSSSLSATINSTSWQTASAEFTAPSTAIAIRRIEVQRLAGTTSDGPAYVTNLLVRRKKNSELIVDGAIIADKLATNSVTTSKIILNGVTTTKIAASAVTAVASAYTAGATGDRRNAEGDAQSATISHTSDADAVEIQFTCKVNQSDRFGTAGTTSISNTTIRIRRGSSSGTVIATRNVTDSAIIDSGGVPGQSRLAPSVSISFSDTGFSGSSTTYVVTVESNYGAGTVTVSERYLQLMATKR